MPPKRTKRVSSPDDEVRVNVQPIIDIPNLNLFMRKELQVQIQETHKESILPTGVLQEGGEIVFNIKGDPERFIDPASIRLKIMCQLGNGDDSQLVPNTNCAPIANLAGSLFSKVIVTLGNTTQITGSHDLYPYLAYLEHILKSTKEYKDQYNFVSLIYRDTASAMDLATDQNAGYTERKTQSAVSEDINMLVSIVSPITNQRRLIIPNVDLSFTLQPSKPKFVVRSAVGVVANRNQKIVIKNISLQYNKIRLNTDLHLSILRGLQITPAMYPVTWQQVYQFAKPIGTQTIRETIFTDRLIPSKVFLFIVSTDRCVGTYETTPWLIHMSNVSEIKLVSGGETFPSLPYKLEIRKVNELYLETKKCLGFLKDQGCDNGINLPDFLGGYGLISFDMSRSADPAIPDMPRVSDLQLHVDYSAAIVEAMTYILIMEYHSVIYLKNNLDVTTEFIP